MLAIRRRRPTGPQGAWTAAVRCFLECVKANRAVRDGVDAAVGSQEKKSHFDHSSEAFEAELTRYCGLSRKAAAKGKDAEVRGLPTGPRFARGPCQRHPRAMISLTRVKQSIEALRAARREFHRASAEYCLFLNDLHTSKKLAFLEKVAVRGQTVAGR